MTEHGSRSAPRRDAARTFGPTVFSVFGEPLRMGGGMTERGGRGARGGGGGRPWGPPVFGGVRTDASRGGPPTAAKPTAARKIANATALPRKTCRPTGGGCEGSS